MKITTIQRARINALWGSMLLFIVPITLGIVYVLGKFNSMLLLALFAVVGLASAAAGAMFFAVTVSQLQQASKEKLSQQNQGVLKP